jgi:hypothetical protein
LRGSLGRNAPDLSGLRTDLRERSKSVFHEFQQVSGLAL